MSRPKPDEANAMDLAILAALVVLAAALRFWGLGWGLRHVPEMDERYFVENVRIMLDQRDLDHRYYEYPGLFFYLLMPAVALAGDNLARAYLLARGLVATVAVANVMIVYRFGRIIAGTAPALMAALLLAVSPVDVQTAHMVRADPVLATLVLLALGALTRLDGGWPGDAKAGAFIGAAVACKFTGLFLAPSYLTARLIAGGRWLRGLGVALLAAGLAFALLSPYAIFNASSFLEGARTQAHYHYQQPTRAATPFISMLASYAAVWPKALGWPGAVLALIGLGSIAPAWRRWLPLLSLPLVTLLVFSSQQFHFDRHMVPSFGVVALLSGIGLQTLTRERRSAGIALAVLVAAFPLAKSVDYVRELARPGTRDRAVDWIETHVPAGSRIVSTVPGLGLNRQRFEVIQIPGIEAINLLQVRDADVVISTPGPDEALLDDLPVSFLAEPTSPVAGGPIRVCWVPPERRLRFTPIPLDRAHLSVPGGTEPLRTLTDGRLDTGFDLTPLRAENLRIELPESVLLGRVEIFLGAGSSRDFRIAVSEDGLRWARLRVVPGRPSPVRQIGSKSRVLLFAPVRVRFVRLRPDGPFTRPLRITEIRFDAVATGAGR